MKLLSLLFFFFLLISSAGAEVIEAIRIIDQNGATADVSAVASYTSFSVGEVVPDRATVISSIAVDVNRMRESGQYSFVKAHVEEGDAGLVLVYTVTAKPRLVGIKVQGAKELSNKKLQAKSELVIGEKADDSTFGGGARNIKEACLGYWYPNAEITWDTEVDEDLNTVFVTYTIDEGKKLAIRQVRFEGNESFEGSRLEKRLKQKDVRWHSFLTHYGQYKQELSSLDVFSLETFYMNEGFLDVQVSMPVLDSANPELATLTFRIDEGCRYHVGTVSVSGMEAYSETDLKPAVTLKPGDLASDQNIERTTENLRAYYGNRGYISSSVRSIRHADPEHGIVDIEYVITEGEIGYINKVNISGNEWTADKVIRRELVVYPSQKYNRSRVRSSENILNNLNIFDAVSITPTPSDEEGEYDLDVVVGEQQTGEFATGVGLSSTDSLVGYAEISEGNFSLRHWPPKGDGQKFKIRAQIGTSRNDLEVSFVESWFMDRRLSLGTDLYHRDSSYYSSDYDLLTEGVRISLRRPIKKFFGYSVDSYMSGAIGYSIERFDIYDVSSTASSIILAEEGERTKSTVDYTWLYDCRDRTYLPSRGNRTTVSPYISGGYLGCQTDIYGLQIRSSQYWPLQHGMILNLRGKAESVEAFGASKDSGAVYGDGVPLFDRFFLGGASTLRGFDYRDVGPSDGDEPIGGNSSAYATLELTYPIWKKVRGAVFYDGGFVNEDSWDFDPQSYHDNWGIGFRFDMPGFPLQLDYAWPITYDDNLSGKPRFNFNIGRSF